VKALTLHCSCSKQRTFRGRDVDEVIDAIDATDWEEWAYAPESKRMAPGHVLGECPDCVRIRQDACEC
jgi:hypothetical protein